MTNEEQGVNAQGSSGEKGMSARTPGNGAPAGATDDGAEAQAILAELREQLVAACRAGRPVRLRGGGTKDFYGNPWRARPVSGGDAASLEPVVIDCRHYRGIVSYEPTELVVTVRCGTPLAELESMLAAHGQCLACEPPHFAPGGTVGGMVAAGLSGPRRMSAGAVRDFILGAVLVSASGEVMSFGGQVMKNVAGYDISRLLVGSMGVLGLIAEVSLKVLPVPTADQSLRLPLDQAEAIRRCNQWGAQPLPLAATAWLDGMLWVRLCGAGRAVESAAGLLGGEPVPADEAAVFWQGLRDHRHDFFRADGGQAAGAHPPAGTAYMAPPAAPSSAAPAPAAPSSAAPLPAASSPAAPSPTASSPAASAPRDGAMPDDGCAAPLWRLSLPSTTPPLALPGRQLLEWGGALRWYRPDPAQAPSAEELRAMLARAGGSAVLFRAAPEQSDLPRLPALAEPNRRLHQRLKQAFDPGAHINPGRLYEWL